MTLQAAAGCKINIVQHCICKVTAKRQWLLQKIIILQNYSCALPYAAHFIAWGF